MLPWDDIQQLIRIAAYGLAGWLVNDGQLDPTNGQTLGGALLGLGTVAWWWFWNRKKATAAAASALV